jgi:hypothetical protein
MSVGGVTPPSPPGSDSNQQPVLRHAGVVPAHSFRQVSAWVAVTPMPWHRNLNLCGSPRSSAGDEERGDPQSLCVESEEERGEPQRFKAVPTSGARGRVRVGVNGGLRFDFRASLAKKELLGLRYGNLHSEHFQRISDFHFKRYAFGGDSRHAARENREWTCNVAVAGGQDTEAVGFPPALHHPTSFPHALLR